MTDTARCPSCKEATPKFYGYSHDAEMTCGDQWHNKRAAAPAEHSSDLHERAWAWVRQSELDATNGITDCNPAVDALLMREVLVSRDAYRDEVEGKERQRQEVYGRWSRECLNVETLTARLKAVETERDFAQANANESARQWAHEIREVVAQGKRITELSAALAHYKYRDHLVSGTCTGSGTSDSSGRVHSVGCAECERLRAALAALKEGEGK